MQRTGPWLFWDGCKDSLVAGVIAAGRCEEHGGTRALYAHLVAEHYRAEYETVFGPLPDLTLKCRATPDQKAHRRK